MIIVKIIGGLGNQLFQYSIGRYLSVLNETELFLDLSEFRNYNLHAYALDHFNIKSTIVNRNLVPRHSGQKKIIRKLLKSIDYLFPRINVIKEKGIKYDPKIIKKYGQDVYLEGYWQSEKYFKPIAPIIRNEICLNSAICLKSLKIENIIEKSNSVSIHIRRGDYVTNTKTNNYFGVCDEQYYRDAVKYLKKKIQNPKFFIFSDDVEWVKKNKFIFGNAEIIDFNGPEKNHEDFWLMSKCKNNIIANSSFSWWSAWLNKNVEKIIISPQKWYQNEKINQMTKDLIPHSWIRM